MLKVGIDDTATMSGTVAGWCFAGLDDAATITLEATAKQILSQYGLTAFHARHFGGEPHQAYDDFLDAFKSAALLSSWRVCACSLYDRATQAALFPSFENVLGNSLSNAGVSDPAEVAAVRTIAPGLLTLQRLTKDLEGPAELSVWIDADDFTRGRLSGALDFDGAELPAQHALAVLYNAYADRAFPKAPRLSKAGLVITDDHSSVLVQAADVIGNFSTSYILSELGATSGTRVAKAKIFTRHFDVPNAAFLRQHVVRKGDDIELVSSGAFTFSLA